MSYQREREEKMSKREVDEYVIASFRGGATDSELIKKISREEARENALLAQVEYYKNKVHTGSPVDSAELALVLRIKEQMYLAFAECRQVAYETRLYTGPEYQIPLSRWNCLNKLLEEVGLALQTSREENV